MICEATVAMLVMNGSTTFTRFRHNLQAYLNQSLPHSQTHCQHIQSYFINLSTKR